MISQFRFYLRIALQNLVLHKARMALALLGILFAVTALFAFGNISMGMKVSIDEQIDKFGKNLVIIRSGIVFATGRGTRQFAESKTLKLQDARRIKEGLEGVEEAVPFFDYSYSARHGDKSIKINVIGAPESIFSVRNVNLVMGGYYTSNDGKEARRRMVVGYKVYYNLFEGENPIGRHILVHRSPTEIVGVIEERGVDLGGQDQDIEAYMPLTTFMRRYSNVDHIRGIYLQAADGVPLGEMKERVRAFIRKIHNLKPSQKDDFSVYTMEDIMKTKEEGIRLVSVLTIIASTISFLIGGLGIFAIMLLSVSERKMEIGIRRVVGSRKRDIIVQFLMESAITSVIGGLFGIVFGFVLTVIVDLIGDFAFRIDFWNLAISFVACVLVGVLAGIYPAVQGTKFEPVKALYF